MDHDKFRLPPVAWSAVQFSGLFVAVQSSLQYLGLQQYSKTHGWLEGLPSTPLIHNVDLLCAFSYLIWLTQCGSVLLSSSKEPMHSLSPGCRDALGLQTKRERDRGRDKGQTSLCERSIRSPLLRHLALYDFYLAYLWVTGTKACVYLSHLSLTVMCGCGFLCLSRRVNDKMCSLFVFVWFVFCRSLASLSSSLLFDPVHTFVLSP